MNGTISALLLAASLLGGEADIAPTTKNCTAAYREMTDRVEILSGNFELSFRTLAIGCNEELEKAWPPEHDRVEKEFSLELQDVHPIQAAIMIRDLPPELRSRLIERLNSIINRPVVTDLFFFDIKVAEFGL